MLDFMHDRDSVAGIEFTGGSFVFDAVHNMQGLIPASFQSRGLNSSATAVVEQQEKSI